MNKGDTLHPCSIHSVWFKVWGRGVNPIDIGTKDKNLVVCGTLYPIEDMVAVHAMMIQKGVHPRLKRRSGTRGHALSLHSDHAQINSIENAVEPEESKSDDIQAFYISIRSITKPKRGGGTTSRGRTPASCGHGVGNTSTNGISTFLLICGKAATLLFSGSTHFSQSLMVTLLLISFKLRLMISKKAGKGQLVQVTAGGMVLQHCHISRGSELQLGIEISGDHVQHSESRLSVHKGCFRRVARAIWVAGPRCIYLYLHWEQMLRGHGGLAKTCRSKCLLEVQDINNSNDYADMLSFEFYHDGWGMSISRWIMEIWPPLTQE
ncbi:hypothetical protein EV702DRAFT_1236877 [Suillus placidus]|uniref:Uncharacterized protein n=1 Tax=Suillus placidus TaxID=48579 RepID=A0A9P6ZR33_9AGAM|nr:hypothetical protein EV702DRAFT_1236877 [Suillus placidus]